MSSRVRRLSVGRPVMVSGGIAMPKCKVYPCGVCGLRVKADSALCVQCGMWIHSKCAAAKMMTQRFSTNFVCKECKQNTGMPVQQEEK